MTDHKVGHSRMKEACDEFSAYNIAKPHNIYIAIKKMPNIKHQQAMKQIHPTHSYVDGALVWSWTRRSTPYLLLMLLLACWMDVNWCTITSSPFISIELVYMLISFHSLATQSLNTQTACE